MLFAAFTSIFWAVQSYAEKRTVSTGISRRDFFYYSCLCLVPFAAIMLFLSPFYFNFSYIFILILLVSVLLRYGKVTSIVSTVEYLVPFESEAYMCLGVIIAYVTDCIFRIKVFSYWGVLSVIIALLGVFLIADVKLQIRKLRINLIIRLFCDVGSGYCARYALLYCSNAMYILLLNLLIVVIFSWKYKFAYHKEKLGIIKLVVIQQFLGFICLFLGNLVAQQSVTAYAFIRPVSLAVCIFIAFFYKNQMLLKSKSGDPRRPKIRDVFAVAFIVAGIYLQTV